MRKPLWGYAAAALLLGASTALAQNVPPTNPSAQQNVRESEQYERLVCTNAAFRNKRMAQECGPITDPQLRQSCMSSFQCEGGHLRVPNQAPPSERIR